MLRSTFLILTFLISMIGNLRAQSRPDCQCEGALKGTVLVWGLGEIYVNGKKYPSKGKTQEAAEAAAGADGPQEIELQVGSDKKVLIQALAAKGGGPGIHLKAMGCGWSLSAGGGYCGNCETETDPGSGPQPTYCEGGSERCFVEGEGESSSYFCGYIPEGGESCPGICFSPSCQEGEECEGQPACSPKEVNEPVEIVFTDSSSEEEGDTSPVSASNQGGSTSGQPSVSDTASFSVSLGRSGGTTPAALGRVLVMIRSAGIGSANLSDPNFLSFKSQPTSAGVSLIQERRDDLTGQHQILSDSTLVDKTLVGGDLKITTYSLTGVTIPLHPDELISSSALASAKVLSEVTIKKVLAVLERETGAETYHGIQTITKIPGEAPSLVELYSTPDSSGGGETIEVHANSATYTMTQPWFTDPVSGAVIRVESVEQFQKNQAAGTYYKVSSSTETFRKLQRPVGSEVEIQEVKIASTRGNGPDQRNSYWFYETGPESPSWARMLASVDESGFWTRYVYDERAVHDGFPGSNPYRGTVKTQYLPWKNAGMAATQTTNLQEMLNQILAVPANACIVEETTFTGAVQGGVLKKRIQKALGQLIWREESQSVVLIDPVTGENVKETRTRRFSASNQILSDTRSAVLGQDPTKTVYQVSTDGTRTTYEETSAVVEGKKEVVRSSVQGSLAHPWGLPYQTQKEQTVTRNGRTVSQKTYVQTGSSSESFEPVSERTYTTATAGGTRTEKTFEDGVEVSTTEYHSDGTVEQMDATGIKTTSFYDQENDEDISTRDGGNAVVSGADTLFSGTDLVTVVSKDPRPDIVGQPNAGYVSQTTSTAGTVTRTTSVSEYNILGDVVRNTDAQGLVTQYSRAKAASGWVDTEAGPGMHSRSTLYYLDGKIQSVTGTLVGEYHDYHYSSEGYLVETVHYASPTSFRWRRTYTDAVGRVVREEQPGFGDTSGSSLIWTEYSYNGLGQMVRIRRSDLISEDYRLGDELIEYDGLGRLVRRGLDYDPNGVLELISREPITETIKEFQRSGGSWWQVTKTRVYERPEANGYRESLQRVRLGNGPSERIESYTPSGALTATSVTIDRSLRKRITSVQQAGVSQPGESIEINGLLFFQKAPQSVMQTVMGYSDFLELASSVTPGGKTTLSYDGTGRLQSETQTSGSEVRTTSYGYYASGHPHAGKLQTKTSPYAGKFSAATSSVSYLYDDFGRMHAQYGPGTYPVKFGFNDYGDQASMTTYQSWQYTEDPSNVAAWTGGTTTLWNFDVSSGLLHYKEDGAGRRTTYAYYPGSQRLESRSRARLFNGQPLKTQYYYNQAGLIMYKSHLDFDTYAPTFFYRRDGSLEVIIDAAGLHTFGDWSADGQAQKESITDGGGDVLKGLELRMPVDSFGRRIGYQGTLTVNRGSMADRPLALPSVTWTYGNQGEIYRIGSGSKTMTFNYNATASQGSRTLIRQDAGASGLSLTTLETSTLAQGMTGIAHTRTGFSQTRSLGPVSTSGSQVNASLNASDPDFGIGGHSGLSRWAYVYDQRGQVIKDEKQYTSNGSSYAAIAARTTNRSFNDIGGVTNDNMLNQLASRSNAGVWVDGLAQSTTGIEVNGSATTSETPAWFGKFISSQSQPQWLETEISIPDHVTSGPDLVQSGRLYVPPTTEALAYDWDGNLISDARWQYVWDAENQLKTMTTQPAAVTAGVPEQRLNFTYDAQGRRVRKKVEEKIGGVWTLKNDVRFIYDGWNLMAEVEYHPTASDAPASGGSAGTRAYVRRSYVWGPDVSGTMDGAGGVGGLLMMSRHERGTKPSESYWADMDLNGNVIGLVSTAVSDRYAVYDYDGFGKCIRANEPESGLNPVRFSSKYVDSETGLSYYGFRYYSPEMGRWILRDPIEEEGGINLYEMVGNDPVNQRDYLGLIDPDDPKRRIQIHHPISYENKTYNFSSHPLVRRACIDLKVDQTMVKLENHAGRHTAEYNLEVQRRLDSEYRALGPNKTMEHYRSGVEKVTQGIIRDIDNGTLRPYAPPKDVKVIEIIPQKSPEQSRSGTLNTKGKVRKVPGAGAVRSLWILDILEIIKMGVWEYRMQTEPPILQPHPQLPLLIDQFGRTYS